VNALDRLINFISPKWGAEREAYRNAKGLQAGYRGAYPTRLSTYWGQSESMTGLPHLNLWVHRQLRDRARSLVENNPIASSILNRAVENIVGNGFKLQVLSDDPDWNKRAEALMRQWFSTADFYGRPWLQHQKLVCYALLRDGDVGSALLKKGQLQLVEGDYISSEYRDGLAYLHDGIDLDSYGRPQNYTIMQYLDLKNRDWKKVPAKDFVFLANLRRVQQYRGETYFAQSFDLFDHLDGYINAAVVAAKIAACLSIFITKQGTTSAISNLPTLQNGQNQQQRAFKLEPGLVQMLQTGEGIQTVNPAQPGSSFDSTVKTLLRILGTNFGMPLEYVLLDFSTVSGQTAKASALQAQRSFESTQNLISDTYLSRVYRWRISKFINDGALEERPDAFTHRWHAEPWPYLDPVKEIQAQQLEIDAGLTTHRRALLSRGIDPDQLLAERAAELDTMRSTNIPILHTSLVQEVGTKVLVSAEENDGTTVNGETKEVSEPQ
jgi:lambda family phage portal protein